MFSKKIKIVKKLHNDIRKNSIRSDRSDQIRSDQIRSDQIRSDQIRSDQISIEWNRIEKFEIYKKKNMYISTYDKNSADIALF